LLFLPNYYLIFVKEALARLNKVEIVDDVLYPLLNPKADKGSALGQLILTP